MHTFEQKTGKIDFKHFQIQNMWIEWENNIMQI